MNKALVAVLLLSTLCAAEYRNFKGILGEEAATTAPRQVRVRRERPNAEASPKISCWREDALLKYSDGRTVVLEDAVKVCE